MTIMRCVFLGVVLTGAIIAGTNSQIEPPGPPSANESAVFGEWSAEVNGLQARVATLGGERGYTDGVYLELRNVGEKAFSIPSLEVCANEEFPWRLQIAQGSDWKDIEWGNRKGRMGRLRDKIEPTVEPAVMFKPRESALMWIDNRLEEEVRLAAKFRLIIQQSGEGPVSDWSGTLETPSASTRTSEKAFSESKGKLPAPTYFPQLNRVPAFFPNGPPDESIARHLWASNWRLLEKLALYQDEPVKRELEKRLLAESNFDMQLILATEAAWRGSDAGKAHILKAREDVDHEHCRSTLIALQELAYRDNAPEWVFDAIIDVLKDERLIMNYPYSSSDSITVRSLAGDLIFTLGHAKCRLAVPMLSELVTTDRHNRYAIQALGQIGDPTAIPILFDLINKERGNLSIYGESLMPETYDSALCSLVALRADGVADELLANVVHSKIIELLEHLGDVRAIPALRQIVSTGKAKQIDGSNAENDRACVEAARIALATLEPGDQVPKYCALIRDQSLREYARADAISRLRKKQLYEPHVIPILLQAAREDHSAIVVRNAIEALGDFHHAGAVTGLIDLFDADFDGKKLAKCNDSPTALRKHIADSLQRITEEHFGLDKAAWEKWWQAQDQSAFK